MRSFYNTITVMPLPVILCCMFVSCSIMHRLVAALHETLEESWDIVKEHLDVNSGICHVFSCIYVWLCVYFYKHDVRVKNISSGCCLCCAVLYCKNWQLLQCCFIHILMLAICVMVGCPSVCLSVSSIHSAVAYGWFAAECGHVQQILIDRQYACSPCSAANAGSIM